MLENYAGAEVIKDKFLGHNRFRGVNALLQNVPFERLSEEQLNRLSISVGGPRISPAELSAAKKWFSTTGLSKEDINGIFAALEPGNSKFGKHPAFKMARQRLNEMLAADLGISPIALDPKGELLNKRTGRWAGLGAAALLRETVSGLADLHEARGNTGMANYNRTA